MRKHEGVAGHKHVHLHTSVDDEVFGGVERHGVAVRRLDLASDCRNGGSGL